MTENTDRYSKDARGRPITTDWAIWPIRA